MFTTSEKACLIVALTAQAKNLRLAASKMRIQLAADAYKQEASTCEALIRKVESIDAQGKTAPKP